VTRHQPNGDGFLFPTYLTHKSKINKAQSFPKLTFSSGSGLVAPGKRDYYGAGKPVMIFRLLGDD